LIYFLVNNNYQMIDVYEHCEHLKDYEKSLIQIPHTLECIDKNDNFKNIFTFYTPFKGKKNFFNILKAKKIEKEINSKLDINKNDILFVYTEFEILNQYIIALFKREGARAYVIDEGFATYITYGVKNEGKLTFKEKIKLIYLKYFLGYDFVEYLKFNNSVFPQINEKYINGVLLYLDANIVRDVKKYLINRNQKRLKLDESKAIFLNEKMYDKYCSKEEYRSILDDIMKNMTGKFEKVYFKFHPRETDENRKWQLEVLKKYSNVQIIEEKAPIENLLGKYDAKYVFSFFSAALFNVNAIGATPVYIYHLYDKISQNNVFKNIDLILRNASYHFIDENYDLKNVGFENELQNNHSWTIADVLNDALSHQ